MRDKVEIGAAVADLSLRLQGGQIQRIWQSAPAHLCLAVYGPAGIVYPVLDARAGVARIAEAAGKPEETSTPWALGQWLRAVALGARIEAVTCEPDERVVTLRIRRAEGAANESVGRLVAWLFPRGGALLGVDGGGIVRVAVEAAGGAMPLAGLPYAAPPPRPGGPPATGAYAGPAPRSPKELEVAAQAVLVERAAEADRLTAERLLRTAAAKLARLRENLTRDRARLEDFERYRLWGELLSAQIHTVRRGATVARVQDWYADPPDFIEIPLEPKVDAARNVERLFQRYRKGRDGRGKIDARLVEVAARETALQALAAQPPSLDTIRATLRRLGLISPAEANPDEARPSRSKATPPTRQPYQTFTSRSGERIHVGRGGADNHTLTFRVARGNDMWLHVRDAPGAHVVVPQVGRGALRTLDDETLRDAAALAVHHSDLRGEAVAEVTVTPRKNVRAVPGGPPGRVTVAAAKTILATDIAARVERLYRERAQGPEGRDGPEGNAGPEGGAGRAA